MIDAATDLQRTSPTGPAGTLSGRCACWSSPTSCPTPARRSAGAGCATRSRGCGGAGSRSSVFSFPPGSRQYLPGDPAAAAAAAATSASTSSTPTTASPAGARCWPARGRWSSPSTAPTSATGSSGRSRAGSPGAPTWSPRSRGRSSVPRTGVRACRRSRARRSCPAAPTSAASARSREPRRAASSASTPTGATCSSPPTRRDPRSGSTGRASWRAACGAELLTGGCDRARADAALDQRRQRGPGHLRLRGVRPGLRRGARLRRASPLDPGRDRAVRAGRDRRSALRAVRADALDRGRCGRIWTPPTRGLRERPARRRSRLRGWRSAWSWPIASVLGRPGNRLSTQ